METLTSILNQQYENLDIYEDLLQNNEMTFEQVGELSREILFYTDEDFNIRYLNKQGRDWFGLSPGRPTFNELAFFEKFYHPDTLQFEIPKIRNYFKNQRLGSIYSNYQQIFSSRANAYCICLVILKKFLSVSVGYLTLTIPISQFDSINKKMQRVISEEMFRDFHRAQFEQLTDRESEVLKLLATGKSNPEISNELFISRHTVEQHRKHINKKLGIHGLKDILDYAYAFDLV
ncbi:MAG: LuxR C-terminal-related transcriptional regulator [Cyclobacteriaceae bacterium]